jgi:hypothetical protein
MVSRMIYFMDSRCIVLYFTYYYRASVNTKMSYFGMQAKIQSTIDK